MLNQLKAISASGQTVIKQTMLLKKRLNNAVMAVNDIAETISDVQADLDHWSFKNQPALERMQDILKKFNK